MTSFPGMRVAATLLAVALVLPAVEAAPSAATGIETEYLATLYAPLQPPQAVTSTLLVFHPRSGGSLTGKVNGKLLQPAGDWVRILPDGNMRIAIRRSSSFEHATEPAHAQARIDDTPFHRAAPPHLGQASSMKMPGA